MTTLVAQFIAANKQQQQQYSGPGNKAGTSKNKNYRKEVEKGKPANNEKRKQDSGEENKTSIYASTTASSSCNDDFQDNSKGSKSKEEKKKTHWKKIPIKQHHYVKLTRIAIKKMRFLDIKIFSIRLKRIWHLP